MPSLEKRAVSQHRPDGEDAAIASCAPFSFTSNVVHAFRS